MYAHPPSLPLSLPPSLPPSLLPPPRDILLLGLYHENEEEGGREGGVRETLFLLEKEIKREWPSRVVDRLVLSPHFILPLSLPLEEEGGGEEGEEGRQEGEGGREEGVVLKGRVREALSKLRGRRKKHPLLFARMDRALLEGGREEGREGGVEEHEVEKSTFTGKKGGREGGAGGREEEREGRGFFQLFYDNDTHTN